MPSRLALRTLLLAGSILGVTATASLAAPYNLETTIAVPTATGVNMQPGGALTGFDISYVDPVTGYYYFADRSNASVDIINGANNTFVSRATGFVGQLSSTAVSGPDGVVVNTSGGVSTLYAGDGNSTLRAFNVTNPASPIQIGTVGTGGGLNRVDEMAFAPVNGGLIFAANNANTPAYGNLINATPNVSLNKSNILVPGQAQSGGMEQPVWDPYTKTFFVSIPTFNGSDAGGVEEFDTNGNAVKSYNFNALGLSGGCGSAGLALGSNGNLLVGCATAGTQTIVLNPTANGGAGSIVAKIGAVSGSDEVYYDPTGNQFYVTGVNASGDRVIDVIDGTTYGLVQQIDLTSLGVAGTVNTHSVAVDPFNGDIFVPLEGTTSAGADTLCPSGCVAVFSTPEPGSYGMVLTALVGLLGVGAFLRRSRDA